MDLEVEVKYLDSKDNRDVQMADYVANLVWKKYSRSNEDLSRRVSKYYKTYISKFPIKLFGHNPSIKQLEELLFTAEIAKNEIRYVELY